MRCLLCSPPGWVTPPGLLDHIRLLHPDRHEDVACWADGPPVIVDETLEPDDFR